MPSELAPGLARAIVLVRMGSGKEMSCEAIAELLECNQSDVEQVLTQLQETILGFGDAARRQTVAHIMADIAGLSYSRDQLLATYGPDLIADHLLIDNRIRGVDLQREISRAFGQDRIELTVLNGPERRAYLLEKLKQDRSIVGVI